MAVFSSAGTVGSIPQEPVLSPSASPPGYISVVSELNLNSKPGAPATLFLDVNGHFQRERVGDVQGYGGWENILTPPLNRDSDPATFSPDEQQEIRFIWALVAEDYAPFNINVTTVDPDPAVIRTDDPYLRVVISGSKDTITGRGLEGFAEIGAYADDDGANVAYVFSRSSDNLPMGARFLANAASHEAGHSFGLEHHSQYDKFGRQVIEYATGNGERAPIMGKVSSSERGTWGMGLTGPGLRSGGGYIVAQDDLSVISNSANGFGYRTDDHTNSFSGATQLISTSAGLFGRGIIERVSDVDMFQFNTGGGQVSVQLQTPQERQRPSGPLHNIGNLDATLRLYDAAGRLLAQDSDPTLLASLSANVGSGTYYVQVGSYKNYGDVGQFTLLVQESTGPQIVSSQYLSLSPTLGGLLVTFNEPINANTFTTRDVRINAATAGTGVVSIGSPTNGSKTFLITFSKTSTSGTTLYVGPFISDMFGNQMDQNRNGLRGEASDYYRINVLTGSGTLSTSKTSWSVQSIDAAFATF